MALSAFQTIGPYLGHCMMVFAIDIAVNMALSAFQMIAYYFKRDTMEFATEAADVLPMVSSPSVLVESIVNCKQETTRSEQSLEVLAELPDAGMELFKQSIRSLPSLDILAELPDPKMELFNQTIRSEQNLDILSELLDTGMELFDQTQPLDEFHLFPKLPVEIRLAIWRLVPRPGRTVQFEVVEDDDNRYHDVTQYNISRCATPTPPLLQACRESRQEIQMIRAYNVFDLPQRRIYFNPQKDKLFLHCGNLAKAEAVKFRYKFKYYPWGINPEMSPLFESTRTLIIKQKNVSVSSVYGWKSFTESFKNLEKIIIVFPSTLCFLEIPDWEFDFLKDCYADDFRLIHSKIPEISLRHQKSAWD